MTTLLSSLFAAVCGVAVFAAQDIFAALQAAPVLGKTVVIETLDKTTARLSTLEVATGSPVRFGSLEIAAMTCEKAPPTEPPETVAFLQIDNHGLNGAVERVFSGWMFASSPGLHALEHPVYDLWVIDCKAAAPETDEGSE